MIVKNKGIDPRIIRTKEKLKFSLFELLSLKSLDQISVSELTEQAKVNRSTFYLHYANVTDLYEEIKLSLLENYHFHLQKYYLSNLHDDKNEEKLLIATFDFIKENKYLTTLLGQRAGDDILEDFVSLGQETFMSTIRINQMGLSEKEMQLYYIFIVNGIIAIVKNWVYSGMRESSKYMAQMIKSFIDMERRQNLKKSDQQTFSI